MKGHLVLGAIWTSFVLVVNACSSSGSGGAILPSDGGLAGSTTDASGAGGPQDASGPQDPSGPKDTGGACDGTQAGAAKCSGGVCLALDTNAQGKAGICSETCSNGTCAHGGTCVDDPDLGKLCVKECSSNAVCTDGFTCIDGGGLKFCFVDETSPSSPPDAGGATEPCAAAGCPISTDVAGYCDDNPAAKKVCDCPRGESPSPKCTAGNGANLYCCP